jgi:3',5'-cyclic AMP phosphodiesterase CpdA
VSIRTAEYPRPDHFLLHLSDTHLLADGKRLYDSVDSTAHLRQLFAEVEASGGRPEAIIVTGDLADKGEPGAYEMLRSIVEPAAERMGARIIWVMGNHDNRATFRTTLLAELPTMEPIDHVEYIGGLRIITLDTSVPGHHYGEVTPAQLVWLARELQVPAPDGTILAMHHPPVPSMLDLAATVELRDQAGLAQVLRGTDVRSILAGHLHYSSMATFAGIPVSVASATCYTQDLNVPVGGTRGRDGAHAFNLVHIYADTVLHSIVPLGGYPVLEYVTPAESGKRLVDEGVQIVPASAQQPPMTMPIPVFS